MGAGAAAGITAAAQDAKPEELAEAFKQLPEADRNRILAALNGGGSSVKVHGLPASANAVGPVLLAMHTGCGGMEFCDVMNGAQMKPEFLALNPFHHIPTVQDGAFAMGESCASLRYIAMKYGPEYYPVKEPELCAQIDFAADSFKEDVYAKHKQVTYVSMGFHGPPEDQEKANKEYSEMIDTWTARFLKGKFVCGDKLSIADFKAVPFLFASIQPAVAKTIGFKASDRVRQYCDDFCAAVPSSAFLKDAGGYSLAEWLKGKAPDAPALGDYAKAAYEATPPVPKSAGGGNAQVFGMPASMNCMGANLLALDTGAGKPEICNIMEGAQMKPEFLAMNPFHHVPTLKDGELCIGEASSICRYLSAKYKPEYYPVGDVEKCGRIDFAMDAFHGDVYPKHHEVVYVAMGFAGAPKDQKKANQEYLDVITTWTTHFLKDKFVCGDKVTAADFKVIPFFFAAAQPGVEKLVGFKAPERVEKYVTDFCAAVPSSGMLKEAGGFAIAEWIAGKAAA